MLKRLIGEDIRLTVSPWPVEARVRADSNQLEQVLLNLALNARNAMPDGGSLEISLAESRTPLPAAVGLPALGEHWTLTVRDTGVGISPEILAHIFEPFFTTKELGKGTGLGLATAYGAVAQSGGRITCESAPGKGTAFHVRLPKTDAPLDPEAAPGALDRGSGKILVVEDDPAIREMFTRALRATGYEVLAAPDAESALLLAEQSGADIRALVTDVVMPGINGRQLAMRLEAERPDLKVVYMSGYTDDAAFRDALRPGTAFLQKPFNASELCRKLKEVLGA
jgi:two-component system, cell cycle sensor histidine kinase and response regulator CckA